ncbi:MAG TPA: hypothetical protein VFE62_01340 [Gemmataceae bacterium]|nr:hypothetical protein [Gemmataceae bacterium]
MPTNIDPEQIKAYEQMNQDVATIRKGDEAEKKKEYSRYLFETQGGAALITVSIGGIFAALINGCIQQGMAERQAAEARHAARYSIQLELQKEKIKERSASNKEMVDLIGQVMSNTQNLVITNGPKFEIRNNPKKEAQITAQITEIRKAFNVTHTLWNKQRDGIQYRIALYYGGDKNAVEAWTKLAASIDEYLDWASGLDANPAQYDRYTDKETLIRDQMADLSSKLSKASQSEIELIR